MSDTVSVCLIRNISKQFFSDQIIRETSKTCRRVAFEVPLILEGEEPVRGYKTNCSGFLDVSFAAVTIWINLKYPKMTHLMKSCFITLALLFLGRVEEGAEAAYPCPCPVSPPLQALCNSGFGKFSQCFNGDVLIVCLTFLLM